MQSLRVTLGRRFPAAVRLAAIPLRMWNAFGYFAPKLRRIVRWSFHSREFANFTYPLTPENYQYLAHFVSIVTARPLDEITRYLDEIREDDELRRHVLAATRQSPLRFESDDHCDVGRRAGWYAVARALKPGVIVETGVDKGLGSVVLCAALARNAAEGRPGTYFGTDINPSAGWLLTGRYARHGQILVGDSIDSLRKLERPIDLFINDSDHSSDYEWREYLTVDGQLSPRAVIIGDNAHASDSLRRFADATGRRFLFFKEVPDEHWYPGAGIGFAFRTNLDGGLEQSAEGRDPS